MMSCMCDLMDSLDTLASLNDLESISERTWITELNKYLCRSIWEWIKYDHFDGLSNDQRLLWREEDSPTCTLFEYG